MLLQRFRHSVLALVMMLAISGFAPSSAVASVSPTPAHKSDPTHPQVMQQAGTRMATASVGSLKPFVPTAPQAAVGGLGGMQREIFGFALASSLSDPTVGYPTWNFSLLTTVAFFGLHVNDDGTFASDAGMAVWNSSQLSDLLNVAHAHRTKVVLTIILQDFGPGTPHMCAALAHSATTIANTVAQVRAKGVDGVNVDYEGLNGSCGSADSNWARHSFAGFAGSLRSAMVPGSYLSVDTYASSAADPYGFFDIGGMSASVDSFFVMAYDLEYANYARAPLSCNQFCLGPTAPLSGYYYNDTSTASQYVSAAGASKVILGVPYYGRKACVAAATANQYAIGSVVADTYTDASTEASAPGPGFQAGSYVAHRDANDPAGQERWDTWYNTSMQCTRELYWDDAASLGNKYALVNNDNLRGVGLWNLNYGGGAPELWSTLSSYFACNVAVSLPASESTTHFTASLSAGACSVAYYEVQQYDPAVNPGGYPVAAAVPSGGSATATFDGFAGHTYQIWARAHSTTGTQSDWAMAATTVAGNATLSHPYAGLYTVDAYGGVGADGSPPLNTSSYWPGWKIARAGKALPGSVPQSGAVLDGWGGLHSYGAPISFAWNPYWPGWDVARDFAFLPDGSGGYILDAFGGLHPFSVNGKALPPATNIDSYWAYWDIARKVVIFSDGTGGYVLDGFGGIHPFGIGKPRPTAVQLSGYWANWDIIHDIALIPGTHSGYVLDGYGNIHPFTPVGTAMPPWLNVSAYWAPWDIARAVWLLPGSTLTTPGGYTMDGYGGLHPFGNASPPPPAPYFLGRDIARNLTGY
ncbi:MAG TPA: glycosyl hydrolase family 18 protein [Candidatus Dormibacteraeota bacterium]|nr:glycosyl hydrolase family 18 protein [Candidatus Dormibacteraeota bacterium]